MRAVVFTGRAGAVEAVAFGCSMVIMNTNRTNYRTTTTTTGVNSGALLVAVSVGGVTRVDYGPTIKNVTGKRVIHRVSTLNKCVKVIASQATVRFHVLGRDGKPTV